MAKVALNKCYGVFSISEDCAKWIEEKYGLPLKDEYTYGKFYFDKKRHAKELVDAIETLGADVCNGRYSKIELENCDDDKYRIEEYDGFETLITPSYEFEWVVIE